MQEITAAKLGKVVGPREFDLDPIARVHAPEFIDFMRTAHADWKQSHGDTDALPICWPTRTFRQKPPTAIDGKLSYYSFDAATPITAGTWPAITASINVALTGVELIQSGQKSVFSAFRPPGHHAAYDIYGGYCFFNNAAVAAQALLDGGAGRVALLDVDYHHGNGSQSIFYHRADVLYVSLHGHPRQEFPYFLGYADETGTRAGEGYNCNFPMPWGTQWDDYGMDSTNAPELKDERRLNAIKSVNELFNGFIDRFGDTDCRTLTGCDWSRKEDIKRYFKDEIYKDTCFRQFYYAVERCINEKTDL